VQRVEVRKAPCSHSASKRAQFLNDRTVERCDPPAGQAAIRRLLGDGPNCGKCVEMNTPRRGGECCLMAAVFRASTCAEVSASFLALSSRCASALSSVLSVV
jgi:hypothetical protein